MGIDWDSGVTPAGARPQPPANPRPPPAPRLLSPAPVSRLLRPAPASLQPDPRHPEEPAPTGWLRFRSPLEVGGNTGPSPAWGLAQTLCFRSTSPLGIAADCDLFPVPRPRPIPIAFVPVSLLSTRWGPGKWVFVLQGEESPLGGPQGSLCSHGWVLWGPEPREP